MWIDFPPNPSIITGISWKPTSRRRLRALGSADRSGVSPSHSKYLFFFWRGAAQLWGHFMCQSLRSHSGTTSKPILAPLSSLTWLLDPKNAQTEKCDVGQFTAVVSLKKVEFFCWKHIRLGYRLTSAFVLPFLFKHAGKFGKVEKKKKKKGCSYKSLAENQCMSLSFLCWLFSSFFLWSSSQEQFVKWLTRWVTHSI